MLTGLFLHSSWRIKKSIISHLLQIFVLSSCLLSSCTELPSTAVAGYYVSISQSAPMYFSNQTGINYYFEVSIPIIRLSNQISGHSDHRIFLVKSLLTYNM